MPDIIIDPINPEDFTLSGNFKRFGDVKPGWSKSVDATTHNIADSFGGTGVIRFDAARGKVGASNDDESDLLIARPILADQERGRISDIQIDSNNVGVDSDTVLSRLNAQRTADPWPRDFYAGSLHMPIGTQFNYSFISGGRATISEPVNISALCEDLASRSVWAIATFPSPIPGSELTLSITALLRFTEFGEFTGLIYPLAELDGTFTGAGTNGLTIDYDNRRLFISGYVSGQESSYAIRVFDIDDMSLITEYQLPSGRQVVNPYLAYSDWYETLTVAGTLTSGDIIQQVDPLTGNLVWSIGTPGSSGNYAFNSIPQVQIFDNELFTLDTTRKLIRSYDLDTGTYIGEWIDLNDTSVTPLSFSITYSQYGGPFIYLSVNRGVSQADVEIRKYANGEFLSSFRLPGDSSSTGPIVITEKGYLWMGAETSGINMVFDVLSMPILSVMIHYYLCLIFNIGDFDFTYIGVNPFPDHDPEVAFRGWTDSVWEKLKELCSAWGLEVTEQYADRSEIRVSPTGNSPTLDVIDEAIAGSISLSSSLQQAPRTYGVISQNSRNTRPDDSEVVFRSATEGQNFQVDAMNTLRTQVRISHSLVSVSPTIRARFGNEEWSDDEVYYDVYDSNDNLVNDEFGTYGGTVEASLADHQTINITITGPYSEIPGHPGPYRFSTPVGRGTLNIGGSGVLVSPEEITIYSGADPEYTSDERGQTIDNNFIITTEQAFDRAAWASYELSGPNMRLQWSTSRRALTQGIGSRYTYLHKNWRVITIVETASRYEFTAIPYTKVSEADAVWAQQEITVENLVENASVEIDLSGVSSMAYTNGAGWSDNSMNLTRDSSLGAAQGNYYASAVMPVGVNEINCENKFPIEPNVEYNYSVYLRSPDSDFPVTFSIFYYNSNGDIISDFYIGSFELDNQWRRFSGTATTLNPSAVTASMYISGIPGEGNALLLDGWQCTRGDTLYSFGEGNFQTIGQATVADHDAFWEGYRVYDSKARPLWSPRS